MISIQKPQVKYKYLIVGDSGVGKTSIMMRYTQNEFQQEYMSTVGIDFKVKKIETEEFKAVLNIWDTAGQERFRTITKSFYKGSHAIILAYSITDLVSFSHIDSWIRQIKNNCNQDTHIILIGCKCDLEEERKISMEEGKKVAERYNNSFFEVSAKTNRGINQTFLAVTQEAYEQKAKRGTKLQFQATTDKINKLYNEDFKESKKKKYSCC